MATRLKTIENHKNQLKMDEIQTLNLKKQEMTWILAKPTKMEKSVEMMNL